MCKFFSLVSDGNGKPYYFDWELRKKVLSGKLKDYEPDSHTSIADYFGFKNEKEDILNKYEYNPFLKKFEVDQINTKDDSAKIEKFCKNLDFKKIIEPMNLSPIIHPFKIKSPKITDNDIVLVRAWASMRASVGASMRASVGASVLDSVGDSVWASVWAYASSFFKLDHWKYVKHEKGKNPFQPCIDLWKKGLVPSLYQAPNEEKVWRLHGGKDAKILWEGKF
jgi:hypothetical protein